MSDDDRRDDIETSNPVWLRVEPIDVFTRHRWIRLGYSSSFFDDPARPLIRFETQAGNQFIQALNGPTLGSAEWIGRVPDNTVGISISPCGGPGPFGFRIDDVSSIARVRLLCEGMIHDPMWAYWALRSRLVNSRQEAWQALKFGSRPVEIKNYATWHARFARPFERDGLDRPRADWSRTPLIRLLVCLDHVDPAHLRTTVLSLQAQIYSRWLLHGVVGDDAPAATLTTFRAFAGGDPRLSEISARTEYGQLVETFAPDDRIGVVDAGDTLPDHTLAVVAERLARDPALAVIYSDEDTVGADGVLKDPIFKPDWSPILQQGAPYVGRLTVILAEALKSLGPEGLALLISNERAVLDQICRSFPPRAIGHLRRILYRRGPRYADNPSSARSAPTRRVVTAREDATEWPTVGVVVPTRDRADLLAECVRGLTDKTDYPRQEIVIVDNGSTAPDALALLRDLRFDQRFKVLQRPGPFNFSALSNDGARVTDSQVLLFLNNDVSMLDSNWLKRLVCWAVMPRIGVVGAKLLFPDGRIQHAGVVMGFGGICGHIYRRMPRGHAGFRDELTVTHEVAAVTGACMAVERRKFEAVGGFDAENLPVDLNDIDLCLRISARGWTNLWTPDSVLIHHQSATRGIDPDPFALYVRERSYFMRRWAAMIRDDPHYHPALSLFAHHVALP